jgi:hypothetical protein
MIRPYQRPGRERATVWFTLVWVSLALPGCPIFSDTPACSYDGDCAPGLLCNHSEGICYPEPSLAQTTCETPVACGGEGGASESGALGQGGG